LRTVEIVPPQLAPVRKRLCQIAIRLRPEDLKALRSAARKLGVGHISLAREIIEAWLKQANK
jgi:hypothetical protein